MRSLGYTRPLYLLPLDHRQSYVSGMFHFAPPLTTAVATRQAPTVTRQEASARVAQRFRGWDANHG